MTSTPTSTSTLDPDSLAKLFAKTITDLTDAEIDQIIAYMRAERERIATAEAAGTRRKSTLPKTPLTADKLDDLLNDLA